MLYMYTISYTFTEELQLFFILYNFLDIFYVRFIVFLQWITNPFRIHFLISDGAKKWTSERQHLLPLIAKPPFSLPTYSYFRPNGRQIDPSGRIRGYVSVNENITFRIYGYHKRTDRSSDSTNIYYIMHINNLCATPDTSVPMLSRKTNCQFVRESFDLLDVRSKNLHSD